MFLSSGTCLSHFFLKLCLFNISPKLYYHISCHVVFHQVWEEYGRIDCTTGEYVFECNSTCGNCSSSDTFHPYNLLDVNILTAADSVCTDTSDCPDCAWNDTSSENVWGICSLDPLPCPDGRNCGPEPCSPQDNDFCVEIEIFDENSTCNATHGAGDYTSYVIADGVCRMDGSGRSYYALQCAEGRGYGVIGCNDCLCSEGCQDIGVDGIPPNTCYQEDWLDNLQIALLGNESRAMCDQVRREIVIQESCPLSQTPTTAQPASAPTLNPITTTTEDTGNFCDTVSEDKWDGLVKETCEFCLCQEDASQTADTFDGENNLNWVCKVAIELLDDCDGDFCIDIKQAILRCPNLINDGVL